MKTWINMIIKFWRFIQGIILFVFGFLAWIPLSVIGIFVIIYDIILRHHRLGIDRKNVFLRHAFGQHIGWLYRVAGQRPHVYEIES